MEKHPLDDRFVRRESSIAPMPATDDMLAEIAALHNPITVGPLSADHKRVLKNTAIGFGGIVLVLLLVAGIGAIKTKGGGNGYAPAQHERNNW